MGEIFLYVTLMLRMVSGSAVVMLHYRAKLLKL